MKTKILMSLVIFLIGYSQSLVAKRTCFNLDRIKDVLFSDQVMLHYRGKDYTISKDSLIIDSLKAGAAELMEGVRSETSIKGGAKIETNCVYAVVDKNQSKIGEVIVTRQHKTCFRPKRVLHALYQGKSVLTFDHKEYTINQSSLEINYQVSPNKPITISLEGGVRDEILMNGEHKVICTYKVHETESRKDIGSIAVTRIIDVDSANIHSDIEQEHRKKRQ